MGRADGRSFLGRNELRPIDAIMLDEFVRDIEGQVAWNMLLDDYQDNRTWKYMRSLVLKVFRQKWQVGMI